MDKLEDNLLLGIGNSNLAMMCEVNEVKFTLTRLHCGIETQMNVVDAIWGLEGVYMKGSYDYCNAKLTQSLIEELKEQFEDTNGL